MKRNNIFISCLLIVMLTGCAKQSQDKEMSAELERVPEETMTFNAEMPFTNQMIDQTATTDSLGQSFSTTDGMSYSATQSGTSDQTSKPNPQAIQTALKNAGFYNGSIDGNLGPQTKRAIRNFQAKNNLSVDGKVGPKTWQKLESYLNSPQQ